jgi:hypothetical protein
MAALCLAIPFPVNSPGKGSPLPNSNVMSLLDKAHPQSDPIHFQYWLLLVHSAFDSITMTSVKGLIPEVTGLNLAEEGTVGQNWTKRGQSTQPSHLVLYALQVAIPVSAFWPGHG